MTSFADGEFDVAWLNRRLSSPSWPYGPLQHLLCEPIGLGFGLSGDTYRLTSSISSGSTVSLVAKVEAIDAIRRAITFRRHNGDKYGEFIAACYGYDIDARVGRGVLLLEDVTPARQGDDLLGCRSGEAVALIEIVARLHALSWSPSGQPGPGPSERWKPTVWDRARWVDRLDRAGERYPEHYTDEVRRRLSALNDAANSAGSELGGGPTAWIHTDPHLDNVLWRPDGRPVLLDWSGAVVGPPSVDLAVLLTSLALGDGGPMEADGVLAAYQSGLERCGVEISSARLKRLASLGLVRHIRSLIGWAGAPGSPIGHRRQPLLRDDSVGRVLHAIHWLDSTWL